MSELKKCPFCGIEVQDDERGEKYPKKSPMGGWIIHCECCGASLSQFRKSGKGEISWNTRPIEDALNARIAELEAAQRWIPVSEPPKECKWKAYVPGWGAPTVNKRYLVKLINDWITIATYYLHVGGGYWKDDRGQELADGVVSLWKGLEE